MARVIKKSNVTGLSSMIAEKPVFRHWLVKSEPESRMEKNVDVKFSIHDLEACQGQTSRWDGVRNHSAKKHLLEMKENDLCIFYHSSCKIPCCVGIVRVVKCAYPDPTQFLASSPYFDAKSTVDQPRWFAVDVKLERIFSNAVTLAWMKSEAADNSNPLSTLEMFKIPRLSVSGVTEDQFHHIVVASESDVKSAPKKRKL